MIEDIKYALDTLKAETPLRTEYVRYYNGEHPLAFATTKFQTAFGKTLKGVRDNLCPIIVEAPADRMEIINFSGDETEEAKAVNVKAWALWQRELMEVKSNEVHKEAFKTGEGFLIVWPDSSGQARFYVQDSRNCCIVENEETGEALFGVKMWKNRDEMIRLTLYYPDRTEMYVTKKKPQGTELKPTHFVEAEPEVPNPYGVIPLFRFQTDPVLADAIPMQNSLNKTMADRHVTQEFGAFPQRWATGLEPPTDEISGAQKALFDGGIARLWFTNDQNVKFGEFSAAAMEPYLKAATEDRLCVARNSGTPLHFFSFTTSDAMSGEALKTLESRFTKRVKRACLSFGPVWAEAMTLALTIENERTSVQITPQWESAEQRSESELLDSQLKKQALGVPNEVLLEELGYTPEDIARFADPVLLETEEEAMAVGK
jgi:hypothetical protein